MCYELLRILNRYKYKAIQNTTHPDLPLLIRRFLHHFFGKKNINPKVFITLWTVSSTHGPVSSTPTLRSSLVKVQRVKAMKKLLAVHKFSTCDWGRNNEAHARVISWNRTMRINSGGFDVIFVVKVIALRKRKRFLKHLHHPHCQALPIPLGWGENCKIIAILRHLAKILGDSLPQIGKR